MLVPNTNTRARCTGDDESAPKTRDSTRRRCTAQAVKDTSTDGPVVAATPGVTARGPKTVARRCACKRGAVHVVAHRRIAAPAMEARPCRASTPQRGSIEPAPSPAFRPSRRWRPCLGAPRVSCLVCRASEPPPRCRPCARPRCRRRPHLPSSRLSPRSRPRARSPRSPRCPRPRPPESHLTLTLTLYYYLLTTFSGDASRDPLRTINTVGVKHNTTPEKHSADTLSVTRAP